MSKLPLVEGVLNYTKENNISFCMPGHKKGKGFLKTKEGIELLDKFIECDITEVDGVDNFHRPEGIIKESCDLLSEFYGSKKSYFLVNGSTSGNLIIIFSSFNEGDKVLVERNCHRSIFNAIIMRKLRPIYIENKFNNKFNAPFSINMEHFFRLIEEHKDAKGIIITYPNYYGICCDLKRVIDKSNEYGMKVLVDSAHGAHFGINSELPENPIKLGADMVVVSSHKTLPSLTQTAFLHIANSEDIEKVDFYTSIFLSTSPSYLFMCSMDYARYYLQEYGENDYSNLISICNKYRKKINLIENLHIVGKEDLNNDDIYNIDFTRYIINLKKGYSAHLLLEYLRKNKIQGEMSDGSNIVLIFSPFNTEKEFKYLYDVLAKCDFSKLKENNIQIINYKIPKLKILPYQVVEKQKKLVAIEDAIGKISAVNIVPYPPGIPIIMMGEVIDINVINMIKYYTENKVSVLGIENKKINIVDI